MPPETFTLCDFVGMIDDEIELMRLRGQDYESTAGLVWAEAPKAVSAEQIRRSYVIPADRGYAVPAST